MARPIIGVLTAASIERQTIPEVRIERDMIAALERFYEGRSCLREFDGGHGRADLLVAEIDQTACVERSAVGLKPLDDEALLRLLDLLPWAPTKPQTLARTKGISTSYVRRLLGRLVAAGFALRTEAGYARIFSPPVVLSGIVAIEAKVSDWRAGLFQCRRYLRYSNTVYLALCSANLGKVDLAALAAEGIGLLAIDTAGNVTEVLAATEHEPPDSSMRTLANEAVWRQFTIG